MTASPAPSRRRSRSAPPSWPSGTCCSASALATLIEALGGLFIGTSRGLSSMAFADLALGHRPRHPAARWPSAPPTIPIVALAPILNNWFGIANPVSKMTMAALLVFFPVFINVTRGLVEVWPASLELMRSYAATNDRDAAQAARAPTCCRSSSPR